MGDGKSIQRIPDFTVDDTARRFALWLQQRCREKPGFDREIADVTFNSLETVRAWRYGQRPGIEALLRALAYGGPRAVNEVLLEPMGMAGARYTDEGAPIVDHLFVAQREIEAARDSLTHHPNSDIVEAATDRALEIGQHLGRLVRALFDLHRARGRGAVVELPEQRERRA